MNLIGQTKHDRQDRIWINIMLKSQRLIFLVKRYLVANMNALNNSLKTNETIIV